MAVRAQHDALGDLGAHLRHVSVLHVGKAEQLVAQVVEVEHVRIDLAAVAAAPLGLRRANERRHRTVRSSLPAVLVPPLPDPSSWPRPGLPMNLGSGHSVERKLGAGAHAETVPPQ
jgi:hypothetical protein